MAENYCELFAQCDDLDGRLLIDRTIGGPALAMDEGEIPFGALSLQGGAIHPYARVSYQQQWIPREACYGPIRSIMGLAPGETITTEVRTRDQVDYVQMVQHAMESSEVRSTTRRQGREETEANTVEMAPMGILGFGSWFEDAWDTVTGTVGSGIDAAQGFVNGAIDTVQGILGLGGGGGGGGGGAPPRNVHEDTITTIDETLDSIQTSESNQTLTETTTSHSRMVERSITRTFSNPYRDRSLELRFIPTFRKFEVVTTLVKIDIGLLLRAGRIRFPEVGMGAKYGQFLQQRALDPRIASIATADLGLDDELGARGRSTAVSEHLNANAALYTKRFFMQSQAQRDNANIRQPVAQLAARIGRKPASAENLLKALAWSRTKVTDDHVQVPLADPVNALSALRLPKDLAERFDKEVVRRIHDRAHLATFKSTKTVHLFIGTHIEAVPGQCILPDVPEPAPIIVE